MVYAQYPPTPKLPVRHSTVTQIATAISSSLPKPSGGGVGEGGEGRGGNGSNRYQKNYRHHHHQQQTTNSQNHHHHQQQQFHQAASYSSSSNKGTKKRTIRPDIDYDDLFDSMALKRADDEYKNEDDGDGWSRMMMMMEEEEEMDRPASAPPSSFSKNNNNNKTAVVVNENENEKSQKVSSAATNTTKTTNGNDETENFLTPNSQLRRQQQRPQRSSSTSISSLSSSTTISTDSSSSPGAGPREELIAAVKESHDGKTVVSTTAALEASSNGGKIDNAASGEADDNAGEQDVKLENETRIKESVRNLAARVISVDVEKDPEVNIQKLKEIVKMKTVSETSSKAVTESRNRRSIGFCHDEKSDGLKDQNEAKNNTRHRSRPKLSALYRSHLGDEDHNNQTRKEGPKTGDGKKEIEDEDMSLTRSSNDVTPAEPIAALRNISIEELKREMQTKRLQNDPKIYTQMSLKQKHDIIQNL